MLIIKILILILDLPLIYFLYKKIFGNKVGFMEAIKWSLVPDIFSLFKGRYKEDIVNEMKLRAFFISCIILFVVEFYLFLG